MAHHIGDFEVQRHLGGDLQRAVLPREPALPEHFVPAAMLPQTPGRGPGHLHPRAGEVRGASTATWPSTSTPIRPAATGRSPPLTDRHWYPIYEKMVEYDIPAMVHVSTSCNACFHTTGAHYINADTTAFMQLIQGDLFKDFPTLQASSSRTAAARRPTTGAATAAWRRR
jgi:4-oxalmesaconate hydratase